MPGEKRFKVGVTIHRQRRTIQELRDAWHRPDELGVDGRHSTRRCGPPLRSRLLRAKSRILDDWCHKIGRDPKEIERTANVSVSSAKDIDEWLKAGLQHFVLRMARPFDTKAVERVLKASQS